MKTQDEILSEAASKAEQADIVGNYGLGEEIFRMTQSFNRLFVERPFHQNPQTRKETGESL